MVLVLKPDVNIVKMYVYTENEVPSSSKVITWTETQTDKDVACGSPYLVRVLKKGLCGSSILWLCRAPPDPSASSPTDDSTHPLYLSREIKFILFCLNCYYSFYSSLLNSIIEYMFFKTLGRTARQPDSWTLWNLLTKPQQYVKQ